MKIVKYLRVTQLGGLPRLPWQIELPRQVVNAAQSTRYVLRHHEYLKFMTTSSTTKTYVICNNYF